MSRAYALVIAASLAALAAGDAMAGDRRGHIAFRHYTSDDGLGALDLVAGLQDRDGFIWAASPNGLFRYDGVRFRRFSVEDGLPSTLITDMAVAPDGVMWGATSRGLFFRRGERFVPVGVDILPVDGMHVLAFDGANRTWITTTRGPYTVTETTVERVPDWPRGEAFGILVEPDGSVLVGRGARLVRRAPGAAAWQDVGHDFVETITSILRDGAGRLWLRAGEHLWMQPRTGSPFEDRSRAYLGAPQGSDGLRLALGPSQTLLIPTSTGLIEVDGDDAHFIDTDLPDDATNIKTVWLDRDGSLWLTSLGLHHELGRGLWRTIAKRDGLPANNVWSILGLADGRIAVGTDAGVALIDNRAPDTLDVPSVLAMQEQPAGVLWIATPRTLVRYDLASRTQRELGDRSGLPERRVSAMAVDHDELWLGYANGGLYHAHVTTAVPQFERVDIPGVDDAMIGGIAFDQGRLWVTTSRGLNVRDHGVWHRFTTRDGLRDDGLLGLVARANHELCATYLAPYGLTCVRYADGALVGLRHLDATTGLNSPVPYFITEDAAGRLWVGGAQGVTIFDGARVDHFTRADGAPGDDCNAGASWLAPNGDVWIGTSSGVGVFAGARYRLGLPPPVVKLGRGQLGGIDLDLDLDSSVTPTAPYDSRLEVELAALSFIDERHIEYQVRLIGFDDDWRAAVGHNARYHHLPPGTYQFAARARHRDDRWGEPTTFDFVVATPFWMTWWFRVVCAAAALVVVVRLVRWRSRALVRRNVELEHTVRERTDALVRANEKVVHAEKLSALGRLLAQLSHEINNPLNVIHNNIGPLQDYSDALCTAIRECRELATDDAQRARLAEIWQRLDLEFIVEDSAQAFAITSTAIKRVASIHRELKAFLHREPPQRELTDLAAQLRATGALVERSWPDVEICYELDPLPQIAVNPGRINQTVTNLLTNAADAMNHRGRIVVRASGDDNRIQIRVADTGPGVPRELRSRIFEPFFTTKDIGQGLGLGLSICREIIVAHGGSLELDDSHAPGACFVIALPVTS